jgi:hypothetical protein
MEGQQIEYLLNKNELMSNKQCRKMSEITGEFHFVIKVTVLNWLLGSIK